MNLTRRKFLEGSTAAVALAGSGCATHLRKDSEPKKIAILATIVRKYSHAQHFIDRFVEGYGWQGRHHYPRIKLVSLYVDQFPDGDLSRDRCERGGVRMFPTVEEALTLGGSRLGVDGVLIIGEHGKYPKNEKNQTLYPRFKWFKQAVAVFEDSGKVAPVFNDKHLSTDWGECREMVDDARRLEFPFMAGSSLPVTWRIPSIDFPFGAKLSESLCICYGGMDSYDFHGYETAQCMSERRNGGEAGVTSVQALTGEKLWAALEQREVTRKLMFAALARSHTYRGRPGYTYSAPDLAWIKEAAQNPTGIFMEHADGLKTTVLLFNNLVQDFTYAGQLNNKIISCQMHLPMPPRQTTLANFFNPLVNHTEQMISSGEVPYPIERTLLTSGMTLFGMESLHQSGKKIETPEMKITYNPTRQSTFWRT